MGTKEAFKVPTIRIQEEIWNWTVAKYGPQSDVSQQYFPRYRYWSSQGTPQTHPVLAVKIHRDMMVTKCAMVHDTK